MADFQADIPQKGDKFFQLVAGCLFRLAGAQDQQVNIGMRMQFATAVTAHGDQRQVWLRAERTDLPGTHQHVIDQLCADIYQLANRRIMETLIQACLFALKIVPRRFARVR